MQTFSNVADHFSISQILGFRHLDQHKVQAVCKVDQSFINARKINSNIKNNQADLTALRESSDRSTLQIDIIGTVQESCDSDLAPKKLTLLEYVVYEQRRVCGFEYRDRSYSFVESILSKESRIFV